MSHIILGKSGQRNVTLDLDVLISTRLLIQANSGGGKSWLLRRLAEQLFAKLPVLIIDPEGEFSTLREKFDYVLVGQGGDVPADLRSARLLAEKLLELRASAVCDLYEAFRSKPLDQRAWVRAFLETVMDAPKKFWRPLVVIVDEAHKFCPQESPKGRDMREREIISGTKDAMTALATAGRKRGFVPIWATQRLAKVDKDASAELLNRMVGMTIEDVDVDRAAELMSVSRDDRQEFKASLKQMEPGNFYAFGRAIAKERVLVKVGPVETTHPESGAGKHTAEPPPAPEKIKAMLPKLADLPKAAEEKAKTEAELRGEIRQLKQMLRAANAEQKQIPLPPGRDRNDKRGAQHGKAPAMLTSVAAEIGKRELKERWEDEFARRKLVPAFVENLCFNHANEACRLSLLKVDDELIALHKQVEAAVKTLQYPERFKRQAQEEIERSYAKHLTKPPPPEAEGVARTSGFEVRGPSTGENRRPEERRSALPRSTSEASPDGDVTGTPLKLLRALADFEALGRSEVAKPIVAFWCRIKHTTGTWGTYLSTLRSKGLVEESADKKKMKLTDAGRAMAGDTAAPVTTAEMLERCLAVIGGTPGEMLRVLHGRYPEWLSYEQLGESLPRPILSSTGTFGTYLSTLSAAEMIVKGPQRTVRCADWMFLDQ